MTIVYFVMDYMKPSFYSFFSIAIAIFSMYFGAGNLIYPLAIGRDSGTLLPIGFFGFFLSGICIPVFGLVAMVLFDGNYNLFFHRLGTKIGNFFIFCCMLVIGPVIAIPRIVSLSHIMLSPLFKTALLNEITHTSSFLFAILFLSITFFATYQEKRIVNLLGMVVGPILLGSLCIIVIQGLRLCPTVIAATPTISPSDLFIKTFLLGYGTLDLIASIFFSSAIGLLLQKMYPSISTKEKVWYVIFCGGTGIFLLAIVYLGLSLIGMLHGGNLLLCNAGDLFRSVTLFLLGTTGSFMVGISVFFACISTVIALAVILAEYTKAVVCNNQVSYTTALLLVLASSIPLSIFGLETVLSLAAGPLLYIGYPTLITLTICNILYKTINFKPVKIPVLFVFLASAYLYFWVFLAA
jgi:branched-chain amino acid:cation transporter, LIVCS family